MADDISMLPLAVTTASGAIGVSPNVSTITDVIAAEPLSQSDVLSKVASAVGGLKPIDDADLQSPKVYSSINDVFLEATRVNAERAMNLARDMAVAKDPAEIFALQSRYWTEQRQVLADQAARIQHAFLMTFATPASSILAKPDNPVKEPLIGVRQKS